MLKIICSNLPSDKIFYLSIVIIIINAFLFMISNFRKSKNWFTIADYMQWFSLFILLVFFLVKYNEVNYMPVRTLFESLIFLAITISIIYFLFSRFFKIPILGVATMLFILAVLFYSLLKKDAATTNLPAALQSIWFVPHVFIYFIGYAALFLSTILGLLYMIYPHRAIRLYTISSESVLSIYKMMHFMTIIGFVFISAGLIIGAVWAKEAWGDYWAWDPKENLALITLLVYALYFHIKKQKNPAQKTLAQMQIIGFVIVIFTYLGMNFLPTAQQSEHVYIEKKVGK